MENPSFGIIGLGVMGHRMMSNITSHGGYRLYKGWDPDADACRVAAETYDGLVISPSAEDLINDSATHVVYIATPPHFHREYAIAAADAGKVVYCEKPLGIDIVNSRELARLMAEKNVKSAVNFPFADAAAVEVIEQGLKSGQLGHIQAIDIRLHFCQWPRDWQVPAAWLSNRDQGGFVRETFSHYAYLTRKLFGQPKLIQAMNRYPDDGVSAETHTLALMDCGGIPVTLAGGTGGIGESSNDRVEFTIWGSKATYRLYDWNRIKSSTGGEWTEHLDDIADTRQDGYRRMLGNFKRFLADEPNTMASFADALAVQELVEEILAA